MESVKVNILLMETAATSILAAGEKVRTHENEPITKTALKIEAEQLNDNWAQLREFYIEVLKQATAEKDDESVKKAQETYAATERKYLDVKARLEQSLGVITDAIDREAENQVDDESIDEHNTTPVQQTEQTVPPTNAVTTLLNQLCTTIAPTKPNTWREFDGTLANWQGFCDAFTSAVHNDELMPNIQKFRLLKAALKGAAFDLIGHWPESERNYIEAWEQLKQNYERPYATSLEIMYKLVNFPAIKQANGVEIERLTNTVQDVYRQLRAMHYPAEHYDLWLVGLAHGRLDASTSEKWELQRQSDRPDYVEFIKFMQQQSRALCGLRSVTASYQQQPGKHQSANQNQRNDNKRAKPNTQGNNQGQTPGLPCVMCNDKTHRIYSCPNFKALDLKNRKGKARELNLCFNCLKPSHMLKECTGQPCSHCKNKHNRLLCDSSAAQAVAKPTTMGANTAQITKSKKKRNKKEKETKSEPEKTA